MLLSALTPVPVTLYVEPENSTVLICSLILVVVLVVEKDDP